MKKPEWDRFFNDQAPSYMENNFTSNTQFETDFIERELNIAPGAKILDLGCGTGRHSVELAKRGYAVTGVDLSEGMLAEAKKAAQKADVQVQWIREDAVKFSANAMFDHALCICEGAFGLLGAGDDPYTRDLTILHNISASLKPGGGFLLTAMSANRFIRSAKPEDVENGNFDLATLTTYYHSKLDTSDGKKTYLCRERLFTAPELVLMCRIAGFDVEGVFDGTAGGWNKKNCGLDDYEIMAICRKR